MATSGTLACPDWAEEERAASDALVYGVEDLPSAFPRSPLRKPRSADHRSRCVELRPSTFREAAALRHDLWLETSEYRQMNTPRHAAT